MDSAWRPSALFARALVDQRHWSRGDAYRWLHRFVCELEHVRTFSRKALQVQLLIFQHAAGEAFLTGIQRDHLPGGVERHRGGLLLILSKIPKSQASTRRPGQTSCSAAALMTAPTDLGLAADPGRSVAAQLLVPRISRTHAACGRGMSGTSSRAATLRPASWTQPRPVGAVIKAAAEQEVWPGRRVVPR